MHAVRLIILGCGLGAQAAFAGALFTQTGADLGFQELLKTGKLFSGQVSNAGVIGSKIAVNLPVVETSPESRRPIADDIMLHTLENSAIPRADFPKWSRWYQEDGHTEVFRLFTGEVNLHNSRPKAARVEAFSKTSWQPGEWHEWSGTYTIVKPLGAAIFQVKNNVNDWAVQLTMNAAGDVILNRRRGEKTVIATNMVAKPFLIGARDDGLKYELYLNDNKVGEGSFARPEGHTVFRWGIYLGEHDVTNDAMIFVSGATVDGNPFKR
jgi:hypothetical protein